MYHHIEGFFPAGVIELRGQDAAEVLGGQIGDQHVDAPGFGNERLAGALGGEIARVGDDLGAFLAEQLRGRRTHVVVRLGDDHALAGKSLCSPHCSPPSAG